MAEHRNPGRTHLAHLDVDALNRQSLNTTDTDTVYPIHSLSCTCHPLSRTPDPGVSVFASFGENDVVYYTVWKQQDAGSMVV